MNPPPADPSPPAALCCADCGLALPPGTAPGFCPHCLFGSLSGAGLSAAEAAADPLLHRRMGDCELLQCIGRGGMGTVYLARHEKTGVTCAVKILSAGELAPPEARRRFLGEAAAASALRHPGIVAIHATGVQDGILYYVMDYVPGRSLAEAVREKPMSPWAAAACMAAVADAVSHAHRCGIIHRDLKPSNILLDALDAPRIADFGLARRLDTDSSLTGSLQIMGSPAWMAPEQASGGTRNAGPAADIYALGAVLYFLLTSRAPFAGDTPQAIMRRAAEDEPLPPRRYDGGIPADLETITLRCLEKSPARRYASAAEFGDDLRRFLRGEPVVARPVSRSAKLLRWARRKPAVAALSAALVLAAGAGAAHMILSNRALARSDREKSAALERNQATLAESLLWQAEFQRLSGRPGQRRGTLEAVQRALQLPLTPGQTFRARNAAIAALALPDATFRPEPALPVPAQPHLAAASANGRFHACVMPGGTIRITSLRDLRPTAEVDPAPHKVDELLAFTYDGTLLACRMNGTHLALVHAGLGKVVWTDPLWSDAGISRAAEVVFRPAGSRDVLRTWRLAYPLEDGTIVERDCLTGLYKKFPPPPGPPPQWRALAWGPLRDQLAAACGSRPEIALYDMNRPGRAPTVLTSATPAVSLNWEQRENWLLAGESGGRIVPWDVRSGTALPPLEGHTSAIRSAVSGMTNNWRIVSAAADGTLRLWDRSTPRPLLTLPATTALPLLNSAEDRIGPAVQGGQSGWYQLEWPEVFLTASPGTAADGAGSAAWSEDGGLFATLSGEGAVVWRRTRGNSNALQIPFAGARAVRFIAAEPNLVIAGSRGAWLYRLRRDARKSGQIRLTPSRMEAPQLPVPILVAGQPEVMLDAPCDDLCFTPGGTLMAAALTDGRIEIRRFDLQTTTPGELLHTLTATAGVRCAFSPDGRWLAAGKPGTGVTVWDMHDGRPAVLPPGLQESGNWLPAFSPDSGLLAISGRTLSVLLSGAWQPVEGAAVPENQAGGTGAAFMVLPGSSQLWLAATGADSEIHLFQCGPVLTPLAVLRSPQPARIAALTVSRFGNLLAALPRGETSQWKLHELRAKLTALGLWQNQPAR